MTLVAALVLVTVAAPATAQPLDPYEPDFAPPASVIPVDAPPPPPVMPRVHVMIGGSLRFTSLDTHDQASTARFEEYGWPSARSPVMPVVGGDVEYLLAPIIDVGVAVSWASADHAAGLDWMEDRVTTTTTQLALVARIHWALGRPFIPEPRVDVGVVRRTIELHGVPATDSLPYLRAGVDWRLGTRRGGAQVSVGYTLSGRASPGQLDPAIGGLDVGIGPYLRF